jgi:hypothetical protein
MSATFGNKKLPTLGAAWGTLLAAPPALVMARPYRLSGCLGTLVDRAASAKGAAGAMARPEKGY